MSTHQHHASELSPVMAAYAKLVAVYRYWNAIDMTDSDEVRTCLRRIDQAKGRLANLCTAQGQSYIAMWQAAVKEAKIPVEEATDATHPQA